MTNDQAFNALTAEVRTRLVQEFSLEELRDLCFDLGIDYELFPQQQPIMARELVGYLHRRRRIPQLVERMQAIRPHEDYSFVARAGIEFAAQTQPIQPIPKKLENDDFKVVWTHQLDARPCATQRLMGSVCVIPGVIEQNGTYLTAVYGLDASLGELRWHHQFADLVFSGDAALAGGMVVSLSSTEVLTGEACVTVLTADGQRRWQVMCEGQHVSAPAVFENRIVVVVDGDTCLVFDARTGSELESFSLPDFASEQAPLATKSHVYFPCRGPRLMAMTWQGDHAWTYDAGTTSRVALHKTPVLTGDRLVVISSKGLVYAIQPSSGEVVWEYDPGSAPEWHSQSALCWWPYALWWRGCRYCMHSHLSHGDELWSVDVAGVIPASLALNGESLICADMAGRITAYDIRSGQQVWQYGLDTRVETQLAVMPENPVRSVGYCC